MIDLFPERMLDGSIHTAILVGIIVLWAMTETFGFVFAGFVVAGYLAAIGMVAPMSLVALVVEAVLTYGIVWSLGVGARRFGLWHRVFGRERFLLFVLVSIPVRLLVEGWAAPGFEILLHPLVEDPGWRTSRFFGIGLVLVPLLANVFWKPGLARGLLQVSLSTGTTWALLAFVLVPLTNFQFSGFELTFESLAIDFLSTPKAYVLLVVTALVAAHNNLRFGWDFGGILVPALLAVITLTPLEFATTLVEIVLLVWIYRGLMTLPWIRDLNLEGPRRIVSMYAVSYALKWVIAVTVLRVAPGIPVADLYGFGYLLTSLVALKCWQKGHTVRVLGTLLATVAQGVVLALGISVALAWVAPPPGPPPAERLLEQADERLDRSILLSHAAVRSGHPRQEGAARDFQRFARALEGVTQGGGPARFARSLAVFEDLGLDVGWTRRDDGGRCLSIHSPRPDAEPPSGLPSVWWCGGGGPGLYVPRPLGDPDVLWATAWLAHQGAPAFVVVAGTDEARTALVDDGFSLRTRRRLDRLRDALGRRTLLAVRTVPEGESWLDPRSALTSGALHGGGLLGALSGIPVRFETDHGALEPLWDRLHRQDGVLSLSLEQIEDLLPPPQAQPVPLAEHLAALAEQPERRRYDPSSPSTRLVAAEVLLDTALRRARADRPTTASVQWIADRLGIEVLPALDADGRWAWILDETTASPRGWGNWVVRGASPGPWVVSAPHAAGERGTAELAAQLFASLQAESLWIGRGSNRFGSANPMDSRLEALPVAQLALRQAVRPPPSTAASGASARLLLVRRQLRPGRDTGPLVLARGGEIVIDDDRQPLRRLLGRHLDPWPGQGWADGRQAVAAMSASGQFPVRYLEAIDPGAAIVAWFSPSMLSEVRGTELHRERVAWYEEHGVAVRPVDDPAAGIGDEPVRDLEELHRLLRHHVETLDDASLASLRRRAGPRFWIADTGQRLAAVVEGDGWRCSAVAGAPDQPVHPLHGCWRTP